MSTTIQHSKLLDKLKLHAETVERAKRNVQNEAQTRQALIDPFVRDIMGYNLANLDEVVASCNVAPEGAPPKFADYAIKRNAAPFLLIEAKAYQEKPEFLEKEFEQLKDYVGMCAARFGLLTDGSKFEWYRCAPKQGFMQDEPFLVHSVLRPPVPVRAMEWLLAVRKGASEQGKLEKLAWQLSIEESIYKFIQAKFVKPGLGDAADLNKAAGLGVQKKDLELVREASKAAMKRHLDLPFRHSDHLDFISHTDNELLMDDGTELTVGKGTKAAWRIADEDWHLEKSATAATTAVLSELLRCDARRKDPDALAMAFGLNRSQSPSLRRYRRIPDYPDLYYNKAFATPWKVKFLRMVVSNLVFEPPPEHPLSRVPRIEWWLPSNP